MTPLQSLLRPDVPSTLLETLVVVAAEEGCTHLRLHPHGYVSKSLSSAESQVMPLQSLLRPAALSALFELLSLSSSPSGPDILTPRDRTFKDANTHSFAKFALNMGLLARFRLHDVVNMCGASRTHPLDTPEIVVVVVSP